MNRTVVSLAADQLSIDPTVQRDPPNPGIINDLMKRWKRTSTGVLVASLRADGQYYLIDGQTRVATAKLVDPMFNFTVEVHHGLSHAQEIDLFEDLNKHRRSVLGIDLLRLRIERGREPYATLGIHLARRGIRLATGRPRPNSIIASEPLEWLLRRPGGVHLAPTVLDVIQEAFPDEPTRWRSSFFLGVCVVVTAADYGAGVTGLKLDTKRLVQVVQHNLPRHWEQIAREVNKTGNRTLGFIIAEKMIERYNKRLSEQRQINPEWRGRSRGDLKVKK